jgi:hypothetical protein
MAETVHVELAGVRTCGRLVEYLGAQGLKSRLVETNEHCELEVEYTVDTDERLRNDVRHALRGWVADRDGSLVLAEVGDGRFLLRPAGE